MAALDAADAGQQSPLSLILLNRPERKTPHKCPRTPPALPSSSVSSNPSPFIFTSG